LHVVPAKLRCMIIEPSMPAHRALHVVPAKLRSLLIEPLSDRALP
jgi:hypothetical protein